MQLSTSQSDQESTLDQAGPANAREHRDPALGVSGTEKRAAEAPSTWPEVRIALVLYGGVSLAIYMYGVVYELWRLVRASQALSEDESGEQANPWVDALEQSQKRVTVDIISGASAGGLNGILLGRALTGSDLASSRQIWLEKAELKTLLKHKPGPPLSLLNSNFFETELLGALEGMSLTLPPLATVLDVFVATTHLAGDPIELSDSLGHSIETKRHRIPVRLRLRRRESLANVLGGEGEVDTSGEDINDFTNTGLLVKVGRATSAFPFAFEPVNHAAGGDHSWPSGYYTDGGVLDNKPFTEAIEAIFGRVADRPVRRWLLSVNPDPKKIGSAADSPTPDFLDVVAAATLSIPRYESVAEDFERLSAHRERVESYWKGVAEMEATAPWSEAARQVPDPEYHLLRRLALIRYLTDELRRIGRNEGAFGDRSSWTDDYRRVAEQIPGGEGFEKVDVAFEIRRVQYLIKLLGYSAKGPVTDENILDARRALWVRFEHVRQAVWEALALRVWGPVDLPGELPSAPICLRPLERIVAGGQVALGDLDLHVDIPDESADRSRVWATDVFRDFHLRDRLLLTVDPFEFRVQRDHIDHAEITPTAAHALDDWVPAKERLAGDTFMHFGGFLEKRWRTNDIMWGRLDAADILVHVLDPGAGKVDEVIERVQKAIVSEELSPSSEADWRAELQAASLGNQGVSSLAGGHLASLAYRVTQIASRMFKGLSWERPKFGARAVRWALRPLGGRMFRALTPLLMLVALIFGRGPLVVKGLAAGALVPAAIGTGIAAWRGIDWEQVGIFVLGWAASAVIGQVWIRRPKR